MKALAIAGIALGSLIPQQTDVPASQPAAAPFMRTGDRFDGLSEETKIVLGTTYSLNLEPGVSARRANDLVTLSTYDGAKVRVHAGAETIKLTSPVIARLTPAGWDLGTGTPIPAASLSFSRDQQDDTDSNLKSMQEAAKKLKSKNLPPQDEHNPQQKLHTRWLYQENPMPTAELFNTAAIQQLTHLSPIGF